MKRVVAILILGCLAGNMIAQDKPFVTYPDNIKTYLNRLHAGAKGEHAFYEGKTKDLQEWRTAGRTKLGELLGLTRMAKDSEDHRAVVSLGKVETLEDHTRQRGEIETEPGIRIPFWLLKPKRKSNDPLPLAICAHGHDSIGYDSYAGVWHDDAHKEKTIDHGGPVAVQAVQRGFIAIAPATRGLATDASFPDPKNRHGQRRCRAQLIHALLAGRTAVGERVWDTQRILDWATKLDEVDPRRVVMLGNSGGGVLTLYAAAMDPRIRVAVPSCSFTSYTSSTGFIFHCDCCLIPRAQREFGDMSDVGGLISPRALLGVNGRKDGLHHFSDVEAAMRHVRAIYTAADAGDKFNHVWGAEGHKFYPEIMWPFIMKHIN